MEKTTRLLATFIILSLIHLLFHSCNNTSAVPTARVIHDTVHVPFPHKAPDSAYLGKYEGMQGPFMMAKYPGSKDSMLIEDYQWKIDSGYHRYASTARGYLHKRDKHGRIVDLPMIIEDNQPYDTLKMRHAGGTSVRVASPKVEKIPDAVHPPTESYKEEVKALWKKLRKVKLPYTYKPNETMELTVTGREIYTSKSHDTIYLHTKLTALARILNSKEAAEPITMEAREVID